MIGRTTGKALPPLMQQQMCFVHSLAMLISQAVPLLTVLMWSARLFLDGSCNRLLQGGNGKPQGDWAGVLHRVHVVKIALLLPSRVWLMSICFSFVPRRREKESQGKEVKTMHALDPDQPHRFLDCQSLLHCRNLCSCHSSYTTRRIWRRKRRRSYYFNQTYAVK
jgi:hypothetical protein